MSDVTLLIPWDGKDEPLLRQALRSFPDRTRRILAINEGKVEMAAAMNAALDAVESEWVFRMDADDLASPGLLELLIEGAGSADGAYPSMQSFGAMTHMNHAEPFSAERLADENMVPGAILCRTSVLRAVGGWRAHPMEDWDIAYRLTRAGYRLEPVRSAIYHYRRRAGTTNNLVAQCVDDGDFTMEDVRQSVSGEKRSWPAVFYSSATGGVAYARGSMMAAGWAPVRETYRADAHDAPVGVWHHANSFAADYIAEDRRQGRLVVVDVDDNYLSPLFVPRLRRAAKWSPNLAAIADGWDAERPDHRRIVAEADLVVCASPALADAYREVNERVVVVRNAVEPVHWARPLLTEPGCASRRASPPTAREAPGPEAHPGSRWTTVGGQGSSRPLRVGWAAAAQHGPDAEVAMPALRWAAAQPGVEVVIIGLDPDYDFPYTWVPTTPSLQAYRDVLSTLDVGICPLKRGGINRYKSDLKWLEYTMGGAATVATALGPYDTIDHGVTGLLAQDRDDLAHQVAMLVGNDDLRTEIASAARKHVLAERTSVRAGDQYRAALAGIREEVAA